MPNKAFFEITNVCNLDCSFCHKTKRAKRFITREEFTIGAGRLRSFADYLYFHLMGEPLLHPEIGEFLDIAHTLGFRVILTTNGTRIKERTDVLLSSKALHKVSISLHCYEVNSMGISLDEYLADCFEYCEKAAQKGIIAVLRLWNIGGEEKRNAEIISAMHNAFDGDGAAWKEIYSGYKIKEKIFLEWGERFEWPDIDAESYDEAHSCYGLRDQIGVLCDGTVVPCCLDSDGVIGLGNIFEQELDDILSSDRAKALKASFEQKKVCEELCRRCGYAAKLRNK